VQRGTVIPRRVDSIRGNWDEVAELGGLTEIDRSLCWGRKFLNPYAFEGYAARPV
jgi:serine/threonine-protein kinase HipA